MKEWIIELSNSFDGQIWDKNGPALLTNVIKGFCKQNDIMKIGPDCANLTIFSPEAFYPIDWREWNELYRDNLQDDTKNGKDLALISILIKCLLHYGHRM